MVKLLIITVNQLAPQNRVRDIIMHVTLRITSHKRLRTCDHYTLVTLIGGKDGAGPSSLHTTLEGPMEYVNARRM